MQLNARAGVVCSTLDLFGFVNELMHFDPQKMGCRNGDHNSRRKNYTLSFINIQTSARGLRIGHNEGGFLIVRRRASSFTATAISAGHIFLQIYCNEHEFRF